MSIHFLRRLLLPGILLAAWFLLRPAAGDSGVSPAQGLTAVLLLGTVMEMHRPRNDDERAAWLAEEAERLERGETPREPLTGNDSLARLSGALRRMALRLHAIDEHAIVAITDRKGIITFVNDRFCAISGYSRDELIGRTHRVINSGAHPPEFFREMWATISAGRVWRGEIENRAKGGHHYFVATTIVPCPGSDGTPEQYIAIRTDVTGQRAAAERLRILSQELTVKNSDLEMLIHAASHDLRSPLVNVQGFASVVGESTETLAHLLREAAAGRTPDAAEVDDLLAETAQGVKFIRAGAEKMDALLKGLLVFSRLGRTAPALQPVDTSRLVAQSLDAMQFQVESAGAEIVTAALPPCLADAQLLDHVISNLLDNAVKYRQPGRPLKVGVSGSRNGGRIQLRVEDNGIGIPQEHREQIFELFHRLDPRHSTGHGLGLAIVRRALDRMGAGISVEDGKNGGTAFVLDLAAPPAEAAA